MKKIKVILAFIMAFCLALSLAACAGGGGGGAAEPAPAPAPAPAQESSSGGGGSDAPAAPDLSSQEYYMVVPLVGHEYWKGPLGGFEAGAKMFGVSTVFTGCDEYDATPEVAVFDQVVVKKPAGIAVAPLLADAFIGPIQKAIDAGIPVVTFDTDAPDSARYTYVSTGNLEAGKVAARTLLNSIGGSGNIALLYSAGQQNIEERIIGFKDVLANEFPGVTIVGTGDTKGDEMTGATAFAAVLQANPDVKAVYCGDAVSGTAAAVAIKEAGKTGQITVLCFDTNVKTLDLITEGEIKYTMAQGVYNMGFWSLSTLFSVYNGYANPLEGWRDYGINPLPSFIDTGITVVDANNVHMFYS